MSCAPRPPRPNRHRASIFRATSEGDATGNGCRRAKQTCGGLVVSGKVAHKGPRGIDSRVARCAASDRGRDATEQAMPRMRRCGGRSGVPGSALPSTRTWAGRRAGIITSRVISTIAPSCAFGCSARSRTSRPRVDACPSRRNSDAGLTPPGSLPRRLRARRRGQNESHTTCTPGASDRGQRMPSLHGTSRHRRTLGDRRAG